MISLAYDALNRLTNMIDAVGTNCYTYDSVGQLLSAGGLWANDTVSYTYNNRLRASLSMLQPDADPWVQTYSYDAAKRMTNTASAAGAFNYAYDSTARMMVKKLSLPNSAYITNDYDSNARLLDTWLKNSGNTNLDSYSYSYNVGNQRTSLTRTLGDYVDYAYDPIGQLTKAAGKEPTGGTNRLLEQLSYGYDDAHNLSARTNNGLLETFVCNDLNELSNVTHTGTLTVEGTTGAAATSVTVNGNTATLYVDNTFAAAGFTVTNGSNSYTAIASDILGRSSTNTVTVYLPATNNYAYDTNGNLLSDGIRTFIYDDENQMISVIVSNGISTPTLTTNIYDGKFRRRIRREFVWQSGQWIQTNEVRYIYDDNVPIQARNLDNLPTATYTRGNDLSGDFQGAGGVGGLLARWDRTTRTASFYHTDGNGNVTALINSAQFIVAKYLYDPYGNILSMSGSLASINLYRFSSKEFNDDSGLIYYLYRFYDPNTQRWLNRDPVGEFGGINLWSFCGNDPQIYIDFFGLWQWGWPPWGNKKDEEKNKNIPTPFDSKAACAKVDSSAPSVVKKIAKTEALKQIGKRGPLPPSAAIGAAGAIGGAVIEAGTGALSVGPGLYAVAAYKAACAECTRCLGNCYDLCDPVEKKQSEACDAACAACEAYKANHPIKQ